MSAAELPGNPLSIAPATFRAAAVPHALHSPEATNKVLHRECARCERSGRKFCLVVIDPGPAPLAAQQLGKVLAREVRQSDEIGYLDDRRLCALLPDTAPAGARRFMARFRQRAAESGWEPITQLFVYPSEKTEGTGPGTGEPGDRRRDGEIGATGAARVAGVEELLACPSPWWKRLTDIVLSATALVVLAPLLLGIGLAIKLCSSGPVFFAQWRSGLGGKPFRIFKFRTMVPDADRRKSELLGRNEQDGPAFKMERDPRVTGIGRLLRVTSLDELPQFWNVLRGDMSLVGPRPLPLNESQACDTWHRRRLDVVPGLTCTWQISGRGTVSFAEWARMDRRYIRRRSLIHDVKLLVLTVPAVLARRGAR